MANRPRGSARPYGRASVRRKAGVSKPWARQSPKPCKPQPQLEAKAVLEPEAPLSKASFVEAAQRHALGALDSLAALARGANSEAVRVSAANAVIDRAYGRPAPGSRAAFEDDGGEGPLEVQWLSPVKC